MNALSSLSTQTTKKVVAEQIRDKKQTRINLRTPSSMFTYTAIGKIDAMIVKAQTGNITFLA